MAKSRAFRGHFTAFDIFIIQNQYAQKIRKVNYSKTEDAVMKFVKALWVGFVNIRPRILERGRGHVKTSLARLASYLM